MDTLENGTGVELSGELLEGIAGGVLTDAERSEMMNYVYAVWRSSEA